jgi:hypothetical protein
MLDVELAAALFRALPQGARLILVGDQDQLPSVKYFLKLLQMTMMVLVMKPKCHYFLKVYRPIVILCLLLFDNLYSTFLSLQQVGPGSLYRDLMACQCVPRVVLNEVFRQAKDGSGAEHIALDSHRVNHGALPRHSRATLLARRSSDSSHEGGAKEGGGTLHAPNGVVQLSAASATEAANQVCIFTAFSIFSSLTFTTSIYQRFY